MAKKNNLGTGLDFLSTHFGHPAISQHYQMAMSVSIVADYSIGDLLEYIDACLIRVAIAVRKHEQGSLAS